MLYAQTHTQLESMDQELELLRLAPPSPVNSPSGSGAGERGDTRLGKGKGGGDAEQGQMWRVDLNVPGGVGGPDGKGPLLDKRGRVSSNFVFGVFK